MFGYTDILIFVVSIVSILIRYYFMIDWNETTKFDVLSKEEIETFKKDGVIIVRSLLTSEELSDAQEEVKKINLAKKSPFPSYKSLSFQNWQTNKVLRKIAIQSKAAKIASQLINLSNNESTATATTAVKSSDNAAQSTSTTPEGEVVKVKDDVPVRLLRDAILGFDKNSTGCGWHVDDKGFWPVQNNPTKKGVNVWIALSPMTEKQGGGLSVAKGSFQMKWAQDAITLIHDTFMTCSLENVSKETHDKFEAIKVTYDVQPGDAIILDRWCFHRTEPFHNEVDKNNEEIELNRYSIRYMQEDAKIVDARYKGKGHPDLEGKDGHELKKHPKLFPQVN